MLVVLFLQADRVSGHDLLRAAQEERSDHQFARDPPQHHAGRRLVGRQILAGRTRHLLRYAQHLRPRHHVHLLSGGRHGSPVPEVSLVEEVSDHLADGPVRHRFPAHHSTLLQRMQLPQDHRLRHVLQLSHVHGTFHQLLHPGRC